MKEKEVQKIFYFLVLTLCFPHNIEVKLDQPLQSGKLISGGGGGLNKVRGGLKKFEKLISAPAPLY